MVPYDRKIASLFISHFSEAQRTSKLLQSSIERLSDLMPLKDNALSSLGAGDLERLDAFRVRFADLQDAIGNKLFRSLLLLEEERFGSQLDVLNKISKRRIITSLADWKNLREIRNLFSHEYPENDKERADALNVAYEKSNELLAIVDKVRNYAEEHIGINSSEFASATEDD